MARKLYEKGLRMLVYVAAALAVVVLLWVANGRERSLALVFGAPNWGKVEFASLRKTRKPNQYLTCPAGTCPAAEAAGEVDKVAPEFAMSASALRERFFSVALKEPLTEQVAADDAVLQYDISQKTSLMRYTDMVTVRFIPLGADRSTLAVYSRSWYGRKDFGVNKERIGRWLSQIGG